MKITPMLKARIKPYWLNNSAIAFDVATYSTGYAIWDHLTRSFSGGSIQPYFGLSSLERVAFLASQTNTILEIQKKMLRLFSPEEINYHVFLESGIARSITNAMLLGEARGSIIGACYGCLSFHEIGNTSWKSTLGIRARESEQQKIEAYETVCAWLGEEIDKTYCAHYKKNTYDESDAYGVLFHALTKLDYGEDE